MTGMVTVRLILYGLIAFVPNAKDSPSAISALLVDARGPQYASDGCRLPPHQPVLYASAGRCRDNGRSCAISKQVERPDDPLSGAWTLDGQSLSVEIVRPGGKRARNQVVFASGNITAPLPANPEEGSSLGWIPQVQTLLPAGSPEDAGVVDEDCLRGARQCPIAARVTLDQGRITSCHLAADPTYKLVFPFGFKPLDSSAQPSSVQAMSDALMVTLQVPRGSKVQINFRNLSDAVTRKPRRTIVLEDRGREAMEVWIANVPPYRHQMEEETACHDMSMDVDRHYELYYNLLKHRTPFSLRKIPYRIRDNAQVRLGSQAQPGGEDNCPLLVFYGDDGRVPNDWKSCGNIQLSAPSNSLSGGIP